MKVVDTDGFYERMSVYVMSSRPRARLFILLNNVDVGNGLPDAARIFPKITNNQQDKLCTYLGIGELRGKEEKLMSGVEFYN